MIAEVDGYFRERGFGFAKMTSADGIRIKVFFHISDVVQGDPIVGRKMEFELVTGSKGPIAKNVRIILPSNPTEQAARP